MPVDKFARGVRKKRWTWLGMHTNPKILNRNLPTVASSPSRNR